MRFVHAATVTLLLSPFLIAIVIALLMNLIIRFEFVLQAAQTYAAVRHIQSFPDSIPWLSKG